MRKDFTQEKLDTIISMIKEIESEQWCTATDAIGDFFGGIAIGVVNLLGLSNSLDSVPEYQKLVLDTCNTTEQQVRAAFERVSSVDSSYKGKADVHRASTLAPVQRYLMALVETLGSSDGSFTSASIEQRFSELAGALPRINPAWAGGGGANNTDFTYGGNQMVFGENWKSYRDTVRKYFPNYSDEEIRRFLETLTSEGCGYVALCNSLFAQYLGRESEFKAKFGFPMYKDDGTLNYEELIIDFYAAEDERESDHLEQLGSGRDDGMLYDDQNELWSDYLDRKGIDAEVKYIEVTPDSYSSIAEQGEVIVLVRPIIMTDADGNEYRSDGGHYMSITGVSDDGKYIVSSWGRKYYIDPKDYENLGDDSYMLFSQTEYRS